MKSGGQRDGAEETVLSQVVSKAPQVEISKGQKGFIFFIFFPCCLFKVINPDWKLDAYIVATSCQLKVTQ